MTLITSKPRFVPNRMLPFELLRSTALLSSLEEAAEDVADQAKNLAPVDEGDYRDSIHAVSGMGENGAEARVVVDDWKGAFIEFGTEDTPTFAPLRRGAEAAGYRTEDR